MGLCHLFPPTDTIKATSGCNFFSQGMFVGVVIEEANRMRKFLIEARFVFWEGMGYIRLFTMK